MKNTFLMSGTLGDAFIVILKLYKPYRKKKIILKRISRWKNQDQLIHKLSKLFKFVIYKNDCISINNINETEDKIKKLNLKYVNTSWDGSHFKGFEKDFKKLRSEPFPKINLNCSSKVKNKKIICIQTNTGKLGGNCKVFSNKWLFNLINLFDQKKYKIILLGTMLDNEIFYKKKIFENKNVLNLVNKISFYKWLKVIKSSDFFISNEGFPAFFSMSQKIKTILFYTDINILSRVHPQWYKNNFISDVGWNNLLSTIKVILVRLLYKRYPYIYPTDPKIIYNYIEKNI